MVKAIIRGVEFTLSPQEFYDFIGGTKQEEEQKKTIYVPSKSNRWTSDDDETISKYYRNHKTKTGKLTYGTMPKLAKKLGRTVDATKSRISDMRKNGVLQTPYMIKKRPAKPQTYDEACIAKANGKKRDFPKLNTVDMQYQPIFHNILQKVMRQRGSLTFKNDGFAIGIEEYNHWYKFVEEFLLKSRDLIRYYGVNGKFVVNSMGRSINFI